MPLSMLPLPGVEIINSGAQMRDRGRYRRAGVFTWLPNGNNGFTGIVCGYAPDVSFASTVNSVSGSIGIDGGAAMPVYGWGAIEIDRWSAGSVQVNGGIAWGVSFPAGSSLPSFYEMRRAIDRTHKDGSYSPIAAYVQYGSVGSTLTFTTNIVNQAGSGVLKALSCMIDYVPPGTTTDASLALDVSIDGVYRFSIGVTRRTLNGDGQTPGMSASVGFIPYASNLTVGMRRSHNGTQLETWCSVLHYLGA